MVVKQCLPLHKIISKKDDEEIHSLLQHLYRVSRRDAYRKVERNIEKRFSGREPYLYEVQDFILGETKAVFEGVDKAPIPEEYRK